MTFDDDDLPAGFYGASSTRDVVEHLRLFRPRSERGKWWLGFTNRPDDGFKSKELRYQAKRRGDAAWVAKEAKRKAADQAKRRERKNAALRARRATARKAAR